LRKLLMVVDDTPECMGALRFAVRRAEHTGDSVVMLYVIEPEDFEHWVSVRDVMRAEAFEQAEEYMAKLAAEAFEFSGIKPEFSIREGSRAAEVLTQIEEDRSIGILVLGASSDVAGPGPLVSELVNARSGEMQIPIVVVPGCMSESEIDAHS